MTSVERRHRFWIDAKAVSSPDGNAWPTASVQVFDGDTPIGSYERNLAGWAQTTFEPFLWDGDWFALYSPDYTTTRVMSLPDCQDIGGEEPSPNGFCPVEYLAPRCCEVTARSVKTGDVYRYWKFDSDPDGMPADSTYEVGEWLTIPTGFIAGCQWGDDTSWKLECVDLDAAAKGQIVRTARFGHVELAKGRTLSDSLRFDRNPPLWDLRATILRQERRDVATGELIDPYDE